MTTSVSTTRKLKTLDEKLYRKAVDEGGLSSGCQIRGHVTGNVSEGGGSTAHSCRGRHILLDAVDAAVDELAEILKTAEGADAEEIAQAVLVLKTLRKVLEKSGLGSAAELG